MKIDIFGNFQKVDFVVKSLGENEMMMK